ncbi:RHS repeat-associated core domain-containing protein [Tenacibaculum maritimum]|uniref:RHS repeat-associated core domain-containing protein n=1 Tax=Tenacibaculum maritimum TaxID=107401 RepID=UPI00293BE0B4|nr:RHS repeat-associated core domain-containing protein [Tenacibaculum maritimum]
MRVSLTNNTKNKNHNGSCGFLFGLNLGYKSTPIQAYDARGNIVWECELDIYGKVRNLHGEKTFIPFRYQGQYEDIETGLYYNRFRYYSPDTGTYISQDPIGLLGNNPNFYAYVKDSNSWIDPFGLDCKRPGGYKNGDVDLHGNLSPGKNRANGHKNIKPDNLVQSHHGIQDAWAKKNINNYKRNSAPATLLPSSSGMSHAKISAAQRARRRAQGGWNTSLKEEFNISYKEMIDAGTPKAQAQKALKDSYKYFDSLREHNLNNPFFNI